MKAPVISSSGLLALVSLFRFAPMAAAVDCDLCGTGLEVIHPEAEVVLPGQPIRTCSELEAANSAGAIDEISCNMLTMFTPEICCTEKEIIVDTAYSKDVGDIVDVATAAGSFSLLVAALEIANLVEALSDPLGPYTVFAPSDAAFDGLPEGVLDALLIPENSDWLTEVLLYHVVEGTYLSTDLVDGMLLTTLESSPSAISVSSDTGVVMVNEATVVGADIIASNGVIHEINDVLVPQSFLEMLPGIIGNLTNMTQMPDFNATEAPTNATTDAPTMPVTNATDAPSYVDTNATEAPSNATDELGDIVEIASAAGTFNYLIAALEATGLVEALSAPKGPYTVFAPLDAAFEALPPGIVDALLTPAFSDMLTGVLLYHVVPGIYLAEDLMDGMNVTTLAGADLTISLFNNTFGNETSVYVNEEVEVVGADIMASNGVIHAIAGVLLPPGFDLSLLDMSP